MIKIALLLGGPSEERGISLNSARSIADHLIGDAVHLAEVIFFDRQLRPFPISQALLYSNTPSDFDFRLLHNARPLTEAELTERLGQVDLAFSVIHGPFGEDGAVQSILERAGVPYVGSGPAACGRAFDKFSAIESLRGAGVATVPSLLVE
jgi:D-alanine-D-alanine ligase-like ATP-grasp enzyme